MKKLYKHSTLNPYLRLRLLAKRQVIYREKSAGSYSYGLQIETGNRKSWMDLTISSDNTVSNWKVHDEDNLTDPRYILPDY